MSRFILMSGTGRIKLFHDTLLQFVQGKVEVRSVACGLVLMKPLNSPEILQYTSSVPISIRFGVYSFLPLVG